jgi:hypothetical protein
VRYRERTSDGRNYFICALKHAAEFLARKDDTAHWAQSMNEELTYWPFTQWKSELEWAGFRVLARSRAYTDPDRIRSRWDGKAELFRRESVVLVQLDFPVTDLLLVGEKE